jgi:hypothetical protein
VRARPRRSSSADELSTADDEGGSMELGMISSTWFDTKIGVEEGIREAKAIGFDTYDIFEDPLDIDDATRKLI